MIKLQRLGHILINVRDIERAKAFYTQTLGFTVLEQDPDHGGLFLSIGEYGNTLDIFQSTNPEHFPQPKSELGKREGLGVRHIAFAVEAEEDLKRAYFALQDAGVPIYRAVDHTSQKSVYFYDPDDNLLEIVWERPNVRTIFAAGRQDSDRPLTFER
jgi:catechol 2,3-dioxygenase-like lactoylglutathione lyase family enzyme